jgi:hypothetical protein
MRIVVKRGTMSFTMEMKIRITASELVYVVVFCVCVMKQQLRKWSLLMVGCHS